MTDTLRSAGNPEPEADQNRTPDASQKPEETSNQSDGISKIDKEIQQKIDMLVSALGDYIKEDEEHEAAPDFAKMLLCLENLDGQVPAEESVCAESVIREEKVFSKKDILELMVLYAGAKNLDLEKMTVARVIRDQKGNLLFMEVKSPTSDGGYLLIIFTIKGRHGGNQSKNSSLDQTTFDSDDMPEGGEIIADYKDGTWVFIA